MNRGTALVVGGTGGLGKAICLRLASEWDAVCIGYRSGREKAERIAEEIESHDGGGLAVRCDLGDVGSIEDALNAATQSSFGLGAVIFAGGVQIPQPYVSQTTEIQWREVIETELIGFTRLVSASLPHFRHRGSGSIVAVTTVANYAYPPGDALSSVPKAAIEALGRAVAKEEGRHGIRANMVAPGIIDAGLGADFLRNLYTPEIWEAQRRRIALRRFGAAEDIAETVAFLASDRAKYITGQTLIVDGGFSL